MLPVSQGKSTSAGFRSDIQGLRAIAVLLVVLYHAGLPFYGGYIGVDVFFVISGFVITAMILRDLDQPGGFSSATFYARRARRLLPALALVILVTLVGSVLVQGPFGAQQRAAGTGIAAMLLSANMYIYREFGGYFGGHAETNPLLHTWSLSVEEQFYLGFPLLLGLSAWIASRARIERRTLLTAAVGLVTLVSFGLCWAMSVRGISVPGIGEPLVFSFYSAPTRAWEFGAGALLAILGWRATGRLSAALAAGGAFVLVLAGLFLKQFPHFPGFLALVPVLATVALIAGGESAPANRVLSSAPLRWIGDRSYSWYLWHWPLIVFSRLLWPESWLAPALAAFVSVIPAALSYKWVEAPWRQASWARGLRVIPVMSAAVLLTVGAGAGVIMGANVGWGDSAKADLARQAQTPHADVLRGCDSEMSGSRSPNCTWNSRATGSPIFLLGDSEAGALSEGVIEIGKTSGRPVTILTTSACPPADLIVYWYSRDPQLCRGPLEAALEVLDESAPSTVVLASSIAYANDAGGIRLEDPRGLLTTDQESTFASGVGRVTARLTRRGHEVIFVRPVPRFSTQGPTGGQWSPETCAAGLLRKADTCAATIPRESYHREIGATTSLVAKAVTEGGGTMADLSPLMCDATECTTHRAGTWLYRDGVHLSVAGSVAASDILAASFDRS